MNFNEWRELASDYIEGTLSPEKDAQVRAFLAQSPQARADEIVLRGLTASLRAVPEADPPLFFADNIIARVQHEQDEAYRRSWRGWLPSLGRLAAGSLVTGGVLAAVVWTVFFPKEPKTTQAGILGIAGGVSSPAVGLSLPKLLVGSPVLHGAGTASLAMDFPLNLENADHGTVIARVPGGTPRGLFFNRSQREVNVLRLPLTPAAKVAVVELTWTGDGVKGEKWVIVPLVTASEAGLRRSFGQPELPLVEAVAAVAEAYGQPVTLEDLPQRARLVRLDARNETLSELLQRHLTPLGLRVSAAEGRLIVSPLR